MASSKDDKSDTSPRFLETPAMAPDGVSLGVSVAVSGADLTPDFVKSLSKVVRTVQGIGDITIGGGDDLEGRCGLLSSCDVNKDRCPVLRFCGTNA